jgi:hypothetical protein
MVPPRPKTYARLRNGRNHAVCVHPFRGGTKWGITLAPLLGNYLGPVTGEFTLVLMACIGDIPWPSTLTDRFAELLLGYRLADTRVQYPK